MPDLDTVLAWRGKTVVDRDGEKLGTLGDLFLDDDDRPAYAGVQTGLFKKRESIIPLAGAREVDGGLLIPYGAEQVREAPNVDPDVSLTDEETERLHAHYGEGTKMMPERTPEIVRSEEEVEFGVAPARPKERVRLKKHTVVEHVEKTVPVLREEIRVEHDPPPEGRIVREEEI